MRLKLHIKGTNARRVYLAVGWLVLSAGLILAGSGRMIIAHNDRVQGPSPAAFDGQRALEHVRRLVALGPRPVGSPAHDRARDYIIEQLRALHLEVVRDDFVAPTPLGPIPMTNIIAPIAGQSDDLVIIGGHYDTKLFTEFTFVGANDGGSSTGALLELARVLTSGEQKPPHEVWIVFFDGEEALVRWDPPRDALYGSWHLADLWEREGILSRIRAFILLDMIGDRDLTIRRETGYSAPWLIALIWDVAARLGYGQYFTEGTLAVQDDHLPFARKGVPAIDLITDFATGPFAPYWHTAEDTLDKLSPRSLQAVGDVVLEALAAL